MKNKELMTEEKKEKSNKNQNRTQDSIIINENNLEDKLKIKKLKNEVNEVKEEIHRLQLALMEKEEELFEIKKIKNLLIFKNCKLNMKLSWMNLIN